MVPELLCYQLLCYWFCRRSVRSSSPEQYPSANSEPSDFIFLIRTNSSKPVWAHILGLATLSLIYVAWEWLGHFVTGVWTYYFFDHTVIGWENVLVAVVAFTALSDICKSTFESNVNLADF
jgi:hypothetical protein